jgi:hypothetical protein
VIDLIILLLIAIPITALVDYFAFKKRFSIEMGYPMKWHYFFMPCLLEISCFAAGVIIGRSGL